MKTKYKLFLSGEFSNWFPSIFTVDGVRFNCGEQYMMYCKVMFFDDTEIANKILKSKLPFDQKELGRKVKNYNDKQWNNVRYELVKKGLREKFTQNENLKKFILNRKGYQKIEFGVITVR